MKYLLALCLLFAIPAQADDFDTALKNYLEAQNELLSAEIGDLYFGGVVTESPKPQIDLVENFRENQRIQLYQKRIELNDSLIRPAPSTLNSPLFGGRNNSIIDVLKSR